MTNDEKAPAPGNEETRSRPVDDAHLLREWTTNVKDHLEEDHSTPPPNSRLPSRPRHGW